MHATLKRLMPGIVLVTLIACATPTAGTVTSVTIDGGDRSLVLGDTITLTATVVASGGASTAVTWTSGTESVATIDATGLVTSLSTGTTEITATSTADPSVSDIITVTVVEPGALGWTRQFGTASGDYANGIAADASANVYLVGTSHGALEGAGAGLSDVYIRSYDESGSLRWTRQFGTSGGDVGHGAATDANGNVYASGYVDGVLEGTNAGYLDAFIRSYDSSGGIRWTEQFGTAGDEIAYAVATDGNGNVYAAGYTDGNLEGSTAGGRDAFVRSHDRDGALRWTRQFGTVSDDIAYAVTTDGNGNVFAAGYTQGGLEGATAGAWDVFIRSYDSAGNIRWTRQFGTSSTDIGFGIATDADGNVYATGYTDGALEGANEGGRDAFVRSYDSDGGLRWTRQFGTVETDEAYAIASDANGNVYSAGYTEGVIEGGHAGGADAIVRSFDSDGVLRWTRQFGTSSNEEVEGIAADPSGSVYAAGYTDGALVGVSAGSSDSFVRKYGP